MSATEKTVVVTGLGVVSGVGTGVEAFWEGLLKGKSSVNRIEGFDPEGFKCQIGSEVWWGRMGCGTGGVGINSKYPIDTYTPKTSIQSYFQYVC